jgi:uncharacterized protein YjiS (DUF1127 family)
MQMLHSGIAYLDLFASAALAYLAVNTKRTQHSKGDKMAHADTSRGVTAFHGLAAAFEALIERHRQHRLYRRTVAELSQLTARERADLGLSGHNLRTAAHEAVYGAR